MEGTPKLLRRSTTTVLIVSSLAATACRTDAVPAFLAVRIADEEAVVRPILVPSPENGQYQLYYAVERGDAICALTGLIPIEDLPLHHWCEGMNGIGKLSCNDGEILNLQWTLTSCQGGYGRSVEFAGSTFYFGFDTTTEAALAQLDTAQVDSEIRDPSGNGATFPFSFRLR